MSCCCPAPTINGVPLTLGGSGDASAFALDFDIVDAASVSMPLVSLPVDGAWALFRHVTVGTVKVAPAGVAEFGTQYVFESALAFRNPVESGIYGVPTGGPVMPQLNQGYLAPATYGAAGYPCNLVIAAGPEAHLTGTGVGGFTTRWRVRGQLWIFDGATRLV